MSFYTSYSDLGYYSRQLDKTELLTIEEEVELTRRIANGDEEARNQLIEANLRLVVSIASKFSNYGVPLADLISEGNIGLMVGIDRFRPDMGAKVSTYVVWWIRHYVRQSLARQSKTIRLPVLVNDKAMRYRRISQILARELGREPSIDELSEELGIRRDKIAVMQQASQKIASLDASLAGDDTATLGDVISDDSNLDPALAFESKHDGDCLSGLMGSLSERERVILTARFGLNGEPPCSLEEVGTKLGLTRERIRQLQKGAIAKMRAVMGAKESDSPMMANAS